MQAVYFDGVGAADGEEGGGAAGGEGCDERFPLVDGGDWGGAGGNRGGEGVSCLWHTAVVYNNSI